MEFLKTITDAVSGFAGVDAKKEAEQAVQEGKEAVKKKVESEQKGVMEKVVDFILKSFPEPFRKPIKGVLKMFGVLEKEEKKEGGKLSVDFKKSGEELAAHIKELRGLEWGKSEISGVRGQLKGVEPRILAGLFLFEEGQEGEGKSVLCTHPNELPEGQTWKVNFPEHTKDVLNKEEFTLYELVGYDKAVKKVMMDGKVFIRQEGKFIEEGGESEGIVGQGTTLEILEKAEQSEEDKNKENEAEVAETEKQQKISEKERTVEVNGTAIVLKALDNPDSFREGLSTTYKNPKETYEKNLKTFLKEEGLFSQAFERVSGLSGLNEYQKSMLMLLLPGIMIVRSGVSSVQNKDNIGLMGIPKEFYKQEEMDPKEHIGGRGKEANRKAQIDFVIDHVGEILSKKPKEIKEEANVGKQVLGAIDMLYGSGVGQQVLEKSWEVGKDAYTKAK